MNTYQSALAYFQALSAIPRMSLHEEKIRAWIIQWAEEKGWHHQEDAIGNLLVTAKGDKETCVCLQAHTDMVCVSDGRYNFETQGISIIEKEEKIYANKTSLGADNGIGIATMMALADIPNRPTLELLFTMGEEVGLVGAQHIELPLHAPYAINLDWSDSDTIGIGCGGTLLMQGIQEIKDLPSSDFEHREDMFLILLSGMQGGHSGQDIRHYRGNALIEILKAIKELKNTTHLGDISGGEADNVIPNSARVTIRYAGHPNLLRNELSHLQKILRTKYKCDTILLSAEKIDKPTSFYRREDILPKLLEIVEVGTGVQVWGKQNTPLSSWNLGILSLKNSNLSMTYFLRTNLPGGIETMKQDIIAGLPKTEWTTSHESPTWNSDTTSPLVTHMQEAFLDEEGSPLPIVTTHATVEAGVLAKKYPNIQWISVGATVHHMHTTREYIETKDFEKFVERMKMILDIFY